MQMTFEHREVVRLVGVPERALRYWAARGVVVPEVATAAGRPGIRRKYSFPNLVACGIVGELLEYGMNIREVRDIMKFVRMGPRLEPEMGRCFLVVVEGVATGMLIDETPKPEDERLRRRYPKWLRQLKPSESLATQLERAMEEDGTRSVFVVAIHRIRDELAARVGLGKPHAV